MDMDEAKAPPDDEGASKEWLDLFRCRVGSDVEILGRDSEEEIADGAADDERLEAFVLQAASNRLGGRRQLIAASLTR